MDDDFGFILFMALCVGVLAWAFSFLIFPPVPAGPTFEQRCHDRGGVVLVDNTECVKSDQLERVVID